MKPILVAAAFAALCIPAIAAGQPATKPSPSTPVTVTNDAGSPVPVQGVVTGTVTGSVEVTNGPNNPVLVTGAVEVASVVQPVQRASFGSFGTGQRFSSDVTLYTVPAGKVFVLDTVTVGSNMSPDDRFVHARIEFSMSGSIPFEVIVQPVAEGVFSSTGANIFNKTQSAKAYAGPGTDVIARGTRDGTALTSTSVYFAIAGHLVDAP